MPTLDAPQSRIEALLQNILGESYDIGEPQSRNEALLMAIGEMMEGMGQEPISEGEITEVINEIE